MEKTDNPHFSQQRLRNRIVRLSVCPFCNRNIIPTLPAFQAAVITDYRLVAEFLDVEVVVTQLAN